MHLNIIEWSYSDDDFEESFSKCTFPEASFNHEAHLRLAWIHIQKYGVIRAIENMKQQIQKYALALGQGQIYHETVTVVAVKIVYHFMKKDGARNFEDMIEMFPELTNNFKMLIASHYSFDVFESNEARTNYIAPDIIEFD